MSHREMPRSLDLERLVIGAVMLDPACFEQVASLQPEHFTDPVHVSVWEAIAERVKQGRSVAAPALAEHFHEVAANDELSVPEYLWRLSDSVTSTRDVGDYAKSLRDLATRRELIRLAGEMSAEAFDTKADRKASDLITDAESQLFALVEKGSADDASSFDDALDEALEEINETYMSGGVIPGVRTGMKPVDDQLGGGLRNSHLTIIGGRPAMGKTVLGLNIAESVARQGEHVCFVSLEMSKRDLVKRILAGETGVSLQAMNTGDYDKSSDAERVQRAREGLRGLPMTIDATPALTMAQVAARARRMKRQHDTKLFVIDYLGLMRGSSGRNEPRLTLMEVSGGLKALAKELDVPVVGIVQLNRNVEGRDNKRPGMADIKESGSIEQDADNILLVHREEYYLQAAKPPPGDSVKLVEWQGKMAESKGKAELIIAKQRHGETGIVDMTFDGPRQQFDCVAGRC